MAVQNFDFMLNEFETNCKYYDNLNEWLKNSIKYVNINNLIVLHLNINSIKKHWNELLIYLDKFLDNIFCLILCETKTKKSEEKNYVLHGFYQIASSRENRDGGGIMMFIKEYNNKIVLIDKHMSETYEYVNASINDILIYGIYRPPDTNKISFINEIEKNILSNKYEKLILCGDININLLNENDNSVNEYESKLYEYGLSKQINLVTREEFYNQKIVKSCLDHIFVKLPNLNCESAVVKIKISDHYPIGLVIYNNEKQLIDSNKPCTTINYNKLKKELSKIKWDYIAKLKDPVEIYKVVKKNYEYLHKVCLLEKKNLNNIRNSKNEWITPYILRCLENRDLLFRKCKSNPTNLLYREKYKTLRNFVSKLIIKTRTKFERQIFLMIMKNMRLAWRFINAKLGRSVSNIDDIILKYFNDLPIKRVADNFALEFIEGVQKVIHNCDIKFSVVNLISPIQSFYLPKITLDNVRNIIKNFDLNKAPGEDEISVSDILAGGENFINIIQIFVNKCIEKTIYPNDLKKSIVRPIFKSGNHKIYGNYRPIALSSLVDKILQKHMTINLTQYLADNNIINSNQYAFQKGKSCNGLINEFSEFVNCELEVNKHVLIIFVDLSKAFDTLLHKIVVQELERIGVIGKPLELIKSYIRDRKIIVEINKIRSEEYEVNVGVGQGTCISPILFLIYVNTLFSVLKDCKALMFADDLAIIVSNLNFLEAQKILQININHLSNWAHDYGLLVNTKKTKVMHIFNSFLRKDEKINVKIHSNQCLHNFRQNCTCDFIEQVENHLYLGAIIDQDFKWNDHVYKVVNRIKQVIPAIYNIKETVPEQYLRMLYFALVHPFIIYCIISWGFTESGALTQLISMQKRILKIMKKGEKFKENENMFKYWDILPIKKQAKLALIIEKYNVDHGELKTFDYCTRLSQKEKLVTPKYVNRFGERTYKILLPKIWNQIPLELRSLQSLNDIKKYIKIWLHTK
jgi:hypothetical protein